jgi:phospholipid transport system substrate-binding protein
MRLRQLLAAALLAMSCLFVADAARADKIDEAQKFVEKEHGTLKQLVEQNAPSDEVRKHIDAMVDYDELTRRTLGSPCPAQVPGCTNHRSGLSDAQYNEIRDLLRKLVEKNYHKNLNKTRDYDVTYRQGRDEGSNLSKIRTEAKNKSKPRDPAVQVDYVIMESGGKYKVIDIVTEGSSMTKNYYDQFHKMLTNPDQGYDYLISKLKKKIATPTSEAKD